VTQQTIVQVRGGRPRSAAAPGTRLSDVYEIDDMIAAGGMGEIYRGRLIETGDAVAIKMIKPEFAENEDVLALFRKEASALHRLHHDSIVRYYVFSVDRKLNRPYLAMEFVEGHTLSHLLQERPLTLEEVDLFRRRIASGLQVAHDRGIVHRDISPDNFILPENDVRQAKIIDFGIARSTALGQKTVIGDGFAGKYNYVSPEQLGMHGGDVTNRSDIYSLGLVLAEALMGKPIDMSGSQVEVIDKRRMVPDLAHIDERLRPLIERMLQPDPKDRPQSMTEVAEWVYQPGTKRRATTRAAERPAADGDAAPRSRMGLIAAGGGAVAAAAAVVAWLALKPSEAPPPAPAPAPPPVAVLTPPKPRADPLAARAPPTTAAERTERIGHYIRYYDGEPCLLLQPVAVSDTGATIDAIAPPGGAVRDFQADFRTVNGFDATVSAAEATPQQCRAIAFMNRVDAHAGPSLALKLSRPAYRAGEPVELSIEGAQGRAVALIAVDEDGSLRDLSQGVRREGTGARFAARLDEQGQARPGRKLLLAFAGPAPLRTPGRVSAAPQDQALRALYDELAALGDDVAAGARIVRIE
jgi:eukaryotic-like serine/threonine-protein kinase